MSKIVKKYPILGSSANSQELSLTVKSILLSIIPLIILMANYFGLELKEEDLIMGVTNLTAIISSLGMLYGLGRKVYFGIYEK